MRSSPLSQWGGKQFGTRQGNEKLAGLNRVSIFQVFTVAMLDGRTSRNMDSFPGREKNVLFCPPAVKTRYFNQNKMQEHLQGYLCA